MDSLFTTLLPLIIGSAVVPMQVLMTVLLLRSSAGKRTAVAWVGGLTAVRLTQGLVFGLLLSTAATSSSSPDGTSPFVTLILLVMAVLFFVTALRYLLGHDDPDAPPPTWLTMTETLGPGRAFAFGVAAIAISPKMWVFTLGAIAAIGAADLGRPAALGVFVVFVVLAELAHVVVLAITFAAPDRAAKTLESVATWLKVHNRIIMIVISLVFGTWFTIKALVALDIV